jgi:hypothetical protein
MLVAIWSLSLVAAAAFGAHAQKAGDPGSNVRFVQTGTLDGTPTGVLTIERDGNWITATVLPPPSKPGLRPAGR